MKIKNILKSVKNIWTSINNIENKINKTTLYDNNSGSNETITLNESVVNYAFIEIFYKSNDELYSSITIADPDGKETVILSAFPHNSANNCYLKCTSLKINGNTITPEDYSQVSLNSSGSLSVNVSSNLISIVKVVGVK